MVNLGAEPATHAPGLGLDRAREAARALRNAGLHAPDGWVGVVARLNGWVEGGSHLYGYGVGPADPGGRIDIEAANHAFGAVERGVTLYGEAPDRLLAYSRSEGAYVVFDRWTGAMAARFDGFGRLLEGGFGVPLGPGPVPWAERSGAHPDIRVIDPGEDEASVEAAYGSEHARLWRLLAELGREQAEGPRVFRRCRTEGEAAGVALLAEGVGWTDRPGRPEGGQDADLVATLADGGGPVEVVRAEAVPLEGGPQPTPGGVVEAMVSFGYGRPSSYAGQAARVRQMAAAGWLTVGAGGRFSVTPLGRDALRRVARAVPFSLDPAFSSRLEAALARIEAGEASPAEVVSQALGRPVAASFGFRDPVPSTEGGEPPPARPGRGGR